MNAHAHHLTRDQVVELLVERDTLRETVRQYQELLRPSLPIPMAWGIRGQSLDLLRALRAASPNVLHRERGIIALYGMIDGAPDQKILDVLICKLRHKLKSSGSGIEIQTVWGRGWLMDSASAALFDEGAATTQARQISMAEAVANHRARTMGIQAEARP
ncbi:winged helix-turn-helix domain-containing protein [Methylobacterium gnaphalii]|uniref:OmpR/PhoB-type domain-containing protein n=1 Tax=Methylobacterium gnaphalii TaxID=1010610 RepID=A0A512JIT5_9HYPH|nr:winged helix-turn-helix domain-containing protein [Methylobacterium gnaphalii]GEP09875.1 hypothetical protein MGN01_17200 [Methylobacterium gnaphalii]GJD67209.1 hypothetical protein MMMDOFMJ_0123 [Methylobacterium gnaphalii]GLS49904.1 hypothetical protein GCM10007885_27560 [Methylobacterium gnaphalii]